MSIDITRPVLQAGARSLETLSRKIEEYARRATLGWTAWRQLTCPSLWARWNDAQDQGNGRQPITRRVQPLGGG